MNHDNYFVLSKDSQNSTIQVWFVKWNRFNHLCAYGDDCCLTDHNSSERDSRISFVPLGKMASGAKVVEPKWKSPFRVLFRCSTKRSPQKVPKRWQPTPKPKLARGEDVSTMDSVLASHPAAPGSIPGIPPKIVDVAEVRVGSGQQRLNNVDRTHLVLWPVASWVLQKYW